MDNETPVSYKNPMNQLLDAVTAPEDAFGALRKRPRWFVFALVCVVIALGASVFIMDMAIEQGRQQIDDYITEHRDELPEQQLEMLQQRREQIGQGPMFYVFFFGVPLVQITLYLLAAAGALNVAVGVTGRHLGFKHGLAVASLGLVTYAASSIVHVILFRVTGSFHTGTSLGVLIPPGQTEWYMQLLRSLADRIDLFSIWTVFLYTVALSEIVEIPKKKAFGIVGVLWAIWAAAMYGLSFIFGGPM